MNLDIKHTAIIALVIIGLIALNVYQWQNPDVVEVPSKPKKLILPHGYNGRHTQHT